MRFLILVLSLFLFTACSSSKIDKYNLSQTPKNKVVSVGKITTNFKDFASNGTEFKNGCDYTFTSTAGEVNVYKTRNNYVIIESPAGNVDFTKVHCNLAGKGYSIKHLERNKTIEGYSFVAKKGQVNYFGDIVLDWKPEDYKTTDMFVHAFSNKEDTGSLNIRVKSNVKTTEKFFKGFTGEHKKLTPAIIKSSVEKPAPVEAKKELKVSNCPTENNGFQLACKDGDKKSKKKSDEDSDDDDSEGDED
jgi:hypothetical protein